jgi:hypothetical protein
MRCGKLRDAWPSAAKAAISMGAQAARLEVAPFPVVAAQAISLAQCDKREFPRRDFDEIFRLGKGATSSRTD